MPPALSSALIALSTSDSGVSSGYVMSTAFCDFVANTVAIKKASRAVRRKNRILSVSILCKREGILKRRRTES